MAPHVLIIGCGDLGMAVARQLMQHNIQVTGVKRSQADIAGVTIMHADVTNPSSLTCLTSLKPQIILYCVAAGGQTDLQYKAHYVEGLDNVLKTQTDNAKLKHVFFVSSTRVYGQQTDQLLDETVTPIPSDFGGERLLEGEQLLAAHAQGHYQTTALRLSGIYGPDRLRMIRLAETAQWPDHDSWSNRIHRDDAAAYISYLIQQVLASSHVREQYIVTDSAPVRQYEVLGWIAKQLHVALPDVAKQTPEAGLAGKRLNNAALRASGYQLQYPDYQAGYSALIASLEAEKGHA
jgi:nucleoside-diphosphate-sugar epimerase